MRLAIVPSNQDRNLYPNGESEHTVMHRLAQLVSDQANRIQGVEAKAFPGSPESDDSWRLQGLYQQMANAVNWLRASGDAGAIVSIHSDSGASHIGFAYGTLASKRLGLAIATELEQLMQTGRVIPFDYSGWVFDARSGGYPSALIEDGSHRSDHDLEYLLNRQDEMAMAIVKGALGNLGVPMVQKETPDQEYFSIHGVPCCPDFAIFRFWRMWREKGFNMGPALTEELDGKPFGEEDNKVQFFENSVVVCKPAEDYACYVGQVFLKPDVWKLPRWNPSHQGPG